MTGIFELKDNALEISVHLASFFLPPTPLAACANEETLY